MNKRIFFIIIILILGFFLIPNFSLAKNDFTCAVYFTGIGCPHCAKADPIVLEQLPKEYPDLVIIEYEIYQQKENAPLLYEYNEKYNSGLGIPLIIFNQEEHIAGDKPILENIRGKIETLDGNKCPMIDGTLISFNELDISSLQGSPKVWMNGEIIPEENNNEKPPIEENITKLTFSKIISLALVDAVNPCAMAVLILMLIAILSYNPSKRKNVLLAGLAFITSVFIMYLIYGLIIIKSFQLIQILTIVRPWLYKILGAGAIILGCFSLKDFFQNKTTCKISPRVDKIINKVTSPRGAFLVGAFVTIFLLPCTIGPYIICGGILSVLCVCEAFPWLLLYNLIFILPMLAIVLMVYFGLSRTENILSWEAKNLKYLNLISGLIILGLGIAMILGLV